MTVPRIYKKLFIILYAGGRCGEFFTHLMNKHLSVSNQNYDYDPVLNKYRTHDPFVNLTNVAIPNQNFDELIKVYRQIDIPRNQQLILRSHNFNDAGKFQKIFPGCKFIILHSENYNRFFENLFAIKFDTSYIEIDNVLVQNWKKLIRDRATIQEYANIKFNKKIKIHKRQDILNTLNKLSVSVKDYHIVELDQLFFEKKFEVYYDLCRWMDIKHLVDATIIIDKYHLKNIKLIRSFGLSFEKDPADNAEKYNQMIKDFYHIAEKNTIKQDYNPIVTVPYESDTTTK